VRGKIDFFNGERVSSQTLFKFARGQPMQTTAGTFRRLAKVMAELGWTA
jgi:hypothetical protein